MISVLISRLQLQLAWLEKSRICPPCPVSDPQSYYQSHVDVYVRPTYPVDFWICTLRVISCRLIVGQELGQRGSLDLTAFSCTQICRLFCMRLAWLFLWWEGRGEGTLTAYRFHFPLPVFFFLSFFVIENAFICWFLPYCCYLIQIFSFAFKKNTFLPPPPSPRVTRFLLSFMLSPFSPSNCPSLLSRLIIVLVSRLKQPGNSIPYFSLPVTPTHI